jgi:DNA-binding NarL/FixJ family response regulator
MERVRILIVDDHRLFRQGLISLLQSEPEFEVVGEAASGEDAVRLAATKQPDVALVDLMMPDAEGTTVIAQLLACRSALGIVVLTAAEDHNDLIGAIQAGARGYVLKNADDDSLFRVIRRVRAGSVAFCDAATLKVFEILRGLAVQPALGAPLTPREQEVLALMTKGANNAEIAGQLVISENTVKTHVSHVLEKLDMRNRSDLIAWGRRNSTRY